MKRILLWVLAVAPGLTTAMMLPFVPETLPMHYDAAGNIDRWGGSWQMLFFPAVIFVLCAAFLLQDRAFEKKRAAATDQKEQRVLRKSQNVMSTAAVAMGAIFTVQHFVMLFSAIRQAQEGFTVMEPDAMKITAFLMGGLLIVLGLLMPKTKRNSVIGLRTPWSIKNDTVWEKSNRMGGTLLLIAGVCTILLGLFVEAKWTIWGMAALLLTAAVLGLVYSAIAAKKYGGK